jgi:hypothetical protein
MARARISRRGASDGGWILVDTLVAVLAVTVALASLAIAAAGITAAAADAWDRLVRGVEERNTALAVYSAREPDR